MGGPAYFSLGSPATTNVMGQQGTRPGAGKDRSHIAELHPRPLGDRYQSGRGDAGCANSPSSALQTSPPPPVGIQSGGTASSSTFPWHDARGDVQIVLTTNNVSGHY